MEGLGKERRRREAERSFTRIFERVVFKVEGEKTAREKRAGEERRRGLLHTFLMVAGDGS